MMGDGTSRFWYCKGNCAVNRWHDRVTEVNEKGSASSRNVFSSYSSGVVVNPNEVCWMTGLSKQQLLDDIFVGISIAGANGVTLDMYGYKEASFKSGLVIVAILCSNSPLLNADLSSRMNLLPGSGRQLIDYGVLKDTLQSHNW